MITLLPPLLFLSPIIAYSIFLFIQESQDPVGTFHDNYRAQKITKSKTREISILEDNPHSELGIVGEIGRISRSKILLIFSISIGIIVFQPTPLSLLLIPITILIYLYYEKRTVARSKKSKSLQITRELPAVTEVFAVLISSGASVSSALETLSKSTSGEITSILREGIALLRDGVSLTIVLDNISQQSAVPELRRFFDSLIIASERGTGLSEVLARQVSEIRSKEHANKLEKAGRAEIALMIPVVFLILPISVLFALWPSYIALGQSVSF